MFVCGYNIVMNNGTILHFLTLENYEGDAFCSCALQSFVFGHVESVLISVQIVVTSGGENIFLLCKLQDWQQQLEGY